MYADLILPFKIGINKAPIINTAAGGIELIIIIFFSFDYFAQDFCDKY